MLKPGGAGIALGQAILQKDHVWSLQLLGLAESRGLASLDDFVEYKHIVLQPAVAAR